MRGIELGRCCFGQSACVGDWYLEVCRSVSSTTEASPPSYYASRFLAVEFSDSNQSVSDSRSKELCVFPSRRCSVNQNFKAVFMYFP
ncbi:hypothetical protein V6N13_091996 [Hibiscus sabdariffa]